MPLVEYKRKRNFNVTPEPGPVTKKKSAKTAKSAKKTVKSAKRKPREKKPIFVIQEHHARRLHWDFRLEADGVLKSWAVPKEPTLDPSVKRLAVQVEDHPLDYAKFHGDIPEGNYGAGHVDIWDNGTYDNVMATKAKPLTLTQSIEAGHVEVDLHGKKLSGRFVLVRLHGQQNQRQPNWLLIKMHEEGEAGSGAATPVKTR